MGEALIEVPAAMFSIFRCFTDGCAALLDVFGVTWGGDRERGLYSYFVLRYMHSELEALKLATLCLLHQRVRYSWCVRHLQTTDVGAFAFFARPLEVRQK